MCVTVKPYNAGGFGEMPSKEADAHMLSTLMQVQDFLRSHRCDSLLPPTPSPSTPSSHVFCLSVAQSLTSACAILYLSADMHRLKGCSFASLVAVGVLWASA